MFINRNWSFECARMWNIEEEVQSGRFYSCRRRILIYKGSRDYPLKMALNMYMCDNSTHASITNISPVTRHLYCHYKYTVLHIIYPKPTPDTGHLSTEFCNYAQSCAPIQYQPFRSCP